MNELWAKTARERFESAALDDAISVDALVIGGGDIGCAAALRLAEGGAKTALIEANGVGAGAGGSQAGVVAAGLAIASQTTASHTRASHAADPALEAALREGPDRLFALVERCGIDCGARRSGALHLARRTRDLAALDRLAGELDRRGALFERLDIETSRRRSGVATAQGAVLETRGGVVHPFDYVRGLARAARAAGAAIYERSPALRVAASPLGGWRVTTPGGAIRAGALLAATSLWRRPLQGLNGGAAAPRAVFQLATPPLSTEARATALPGGEGALDAAEPATAWRLDRAGRLVFGALGGLEGRLGAVNRAWATRRLRALYPELAAALGAAPFQTAWSGRIALNADGAPRLAEIGPNGLAAEGVSGRGLAPGLVFAEAAAEILLQGADAAPAGPIRPCEIKKGGRPRGAGLWAETLTAAARWAERGG